MFDNIVSGISDLAAPKQTQSTSSPAEVERIAQQEKTNRLLIAGAMLIVLVAIAAGSYMYSQK